MSWQEAEAEYQKALKQGLKEVATLQAKGLHPYPTVLDDILEGKKIDATQFLGTLDIPVDRVVGTKTPGRQSAFSASFLPLLDSTSEFALKWIPLCNDHLGDEGIRDAIICYEYLGNFYVQEGNKRLSVLRYFGATGIASQVYRILPEADGSTEMRVYEEFTRFFKHARVYDVQFSQPGDYTRLLKYMGMDPEQDWTEEDRRKFRAYCSYFKEAYHSLGGSQLKTSFGDAMLRWLQVHPYSELGELSTAQLKKSLSDMWENILSLEAPEPVFRTEAPSSENRFGLLSVMMRPSRINVAFVHQRTPETSPWTNAHDAGRKHLENALGKAVNVRSYFGADTLEQAEEIMELAVAEGAEVVFATTPQLIDPCLKLSIRYPKVRFMNCSVHKSYPTVHTYYSRIYESKFITGAIAGALADNNRIGYVGSYPIYGVPASINAFALGAMLTNPRATIELKWSCLPGNPTKEFLDDGIWVISNRDTPVDEKLFTEYGTYTVNKQGEFIPLGSPTWVWGKFYENVVRSMLSRTWDVNKKGQAINDWWGLSSGVIDVKLADDLPEGIKTLAKFLQEGLRSGTLDPFKRKLVAQDGSIINNGNRTLTTDELLHMDWLCSNISGSIPQFDELLPFAKPTVRLLGIYQDQIPVE